MLDRKKFLKDGLKSLLRKVQETKDMVSEVPLIVKESLTEKVSVEEEKSAFRTIPEFTKLKQVRRNIKFPPGAVKPEKVFKSKCNSCGDCINACPYNTLFPVLDSKENRNFPFLDPNLTACQLCKDTPCIKSCSTGALKKIKKNDTIKFGKAKLLYDNCLNYFSDSNSCNACQLSCPVEKAISIKNNKPTFTNLCVGCGICAQACPTFPKAILIK